MAWSNRLSTTLKDRKSWSHFNLTVTFALSESVGKNWTNFVARVGDNCNFNVVCNVADDIYSKLCSIFETFIVRHFKWKSFKKSLLIAIFQLCKNVGLFWLWNIYGTHIWGQNPVKPGPPMMKFVYTQSLLCWCLLNCIRATVNDKKSNVRWINRLRRNAEEQVKREQNREDIQRWF